MSPTMVVCVELAGYELIHTVGGYSTPLFKSLGVPVVTVAKENHLAVQNEIFYKYLNNVHHLHATNKSSLQEWRLGTKCVVYSWKVSPVDGMYI